MKTDDAFAFNVVESDGESVAIEVSEDDYRRSIPALDSPAYITYTCHKVESSPMARSFSTI